MAKTQAELASDLRSLTTQVSKIGDEISATLQKVLDLETALNNAGTPVTPEVEDALKALKLQAQKTDDLIPEVLPPVPPTPAPPVPPSAP